MSKRYIPKNDRDTKVVYERWYKASIIDISMIIDAGWLNKNCSGMWCIPPISISTLFFDKEEDAVLYKLTWT